MLSRWRRLLAAAVLVGAGTAGILASDSGSAPAASTLPPIKHVFIIVLENESEATSFGPGAPSPYLAQTLPSMGVFLPNYYAIGHNSLDNYIALISGQAPDEQTKADCGTYEEFALTGFAENEQAEGHGCVYPSSVHNITEQLTAQGDTWKGYMQSMPRACAHPTLGGPDEEKGKAGDEYATRHDPFVYFKSITEHSGAYCEEHVVNLSALEADLSSAATTPNYVWITPDVCSDGHESVCQESSRPAGFAGINEFLSTWVPRITSSPAFKESGLLAVTFDESDTGDAENATACCGEKPGPNAPLPGGTGPGGGKIGAVLVSPFITPGTTSNTEYNHYSLLASIEDLFGLPNLGMAGVAGLPTFGSDVYSRPGGTKEAEEKAKKAEEEAAAKKKAEEEAAAAKKKAEEEAAAKQRAEEAALFGRIRAALGAELIPSGKGAKIAALVKAGGFSVRFKALAGGTAVIDWYYLPPGAKLAAKAKPVLVASGKATFPSARTSVIKLKLTAAGRRLLKRVKKLKLTAKGTFTPAGKTPIVATRTFVLKR